MGRIALIGVAVVLGACNHVPVPLPPYDGTEPIIDVVAAQCGPCHSRSHPEVVANPAPLAGALAAFDLDDPDWLAGIPSATFERVFMARLWPWIDVQTTAAEAHAEIAAALARACAADVASSGSE